MAQNNNTVNYYNSPIPHGSYMSGGTTSSVLGPLPTVSRMAFMQGHQLEVPQRQHWSYPQQQYQPFPKPPEIQSSWSNPLPSLRYSAFQPTKSYVPQPLYMSPGNIMSLPSTLGHPPPGPSMDMYSTTMNMNLPQYIPSPVMQNPFHVNRTSGYGASSITPSTTIPSSASFTSAGTEYEEDFSEKLIAYARFNRNTNLMKEILSEVAVPDVSQIVTTTRLENLKTQVRAIEEHTAKMQKEIGEMSERYRKKREEFKASCAKFHASYPRECKRKTFTQRSLERIEAKWYNRFKTEHPRNWARYLSETGPLPKTAVLIKPAVRVDHSVQVKQAIPAKVEHQQPPAPSTPIAITEPSGIADFNFHHSPTGASTFEDSSSIDLKDSSCQFADFDQEFFNQPEMTFKNSHKNPLCGKDLLISGSENYLRALLNRGSAAPRYNNQAHTSTWPNSHQ